MALSLALVASDIIHSSAGDAILRFTRVRSSVGEISDLIADGYRRSVTFHALVERLQASNVIVSIQPAACAGGRIRSCLAGVKGSDLERHIWIKVDPQHTIKNRLIATMAHELQHAVEIAEHPEIVDAASALRFYRTVSIGPCGRRLSDECETTRALDTERQVVDELSRPVTRK